MAYVQRRRPPRRANTPPVHAYYLRSSRVASPLGGYGYEYDDSGLEGFSLKGLVKGIGKIGTNIGKTVKKAARDTAAEVKRHPALYGTIAGAALLPFVPGAVGALGAAGRAVGRGALKSIPALLGGKRHAALPAAPTVLPQMPAATGGGAVPPDYSPITDQGVPGVAPAFDGGGSGGGGGASPPDVDMATAPQQAGAGGGLLPVVIGAGLLLAVSRTPSRRARR